MPDQFLLLFSVLIMWCIAKIAHKKCPKNPKPGSFCRFCPLSPTRALPWTQTPAFWGPPFNKSWIHQRHVVFLYLCKGRVAQYFCPYKYMVYLPVLGFQLLGGLHWAFITAITGSEATSLLWTWNCCVSNVSL